MALQSPSIQSGIPALDQALQHIRLGDNVVWQVNDLEDYFFFARPFAEQSLRDGYPLVYLRFASHPPVLEAQPGLEIIEVDPSHGFDSFSGKVHQIIEQKGLKCFYVFDNISTLVAEWATDELLANFFQVTCPFLFELDTVAYFALTLGNHDDATVVRIRDTTQILINLYRVKETLYFHPIKVWERYSNQMFLPHMVSGEDVSPIFQSGDAAEIIASARKHPLRAGDETIAPWESVYRTLYQYYKNGERECDGRPEFLSLKEELTEMIFGNQPEILDLAQNYLTAKELFQIRNRIIGSGKIGGKAAGMLLARSILNKTDGDLNFAGKMEDHDSFYIGSDVFFTFLVKNKLFRLRLHLTRGGDISTDEFDDVEQRFLEGVFPREIMDQFQNMLDYFGQAPIIVRSSSLLEDGFGNAFAGKYRSEFCSNQGSPEMRMEAFLRAVKLVYASALNPDALSYRRKRGLQEKDEQMALLVQRVSGSYYKRFFFPSLAGVAFSQNLYAWTDRIDPKKGLIRLVFGLGTRAVDRIGGDYPRMISVSHPELRPEVGDKVVKYSQREVDVINLEENRFETCYFADVVAERDYPHLHMFISTLVDGYLSDPASMFFEGQAEDFVLTFNNLIVKTELVPILGAMLERLERAYGHPVDTEFTASLDSKGQARVNLLQCRPLGMQGAEGRDVKIPEDIPAEQVLFRASRIVNGGIVSNIRYIVLIDPQVYSSIQPLDRKQSVGRMV
ncbi:MAG: PEP/pyruvate-binding domain-containing protein, partial [bacterium]|nr:PEP/pyruvate-binding domain-containing protein [bacterium]